MPFDDLDLEFEDEDELKSKAKPQKVTPVVPVQLARPAVAEVKKLDQTQVAVRAPIHSSQNTVSQLRVVGTAALKENSQIIDMNQLHLEIKQIEVQAQVKVALAEFKMEFLTDFMSDMKLMEYQISQLLVRVHGKHPDIKQEALMIKKILADFTAKKRK